MTNPKWQERKQYWINRKNLVWEKEDFEILKYQKDVEKIKKESTHVIEYSAITDILKDVEGLLSYINNFTNCDSVYGETVIGFHLVHSQACRKCRALRTWHEKGYGN